MKKAALLLSTLSLFL